MREAPAGARLLGSVSGLLAVMSLLAGGFVVVSTLLLICENHFAGPVRDFWHIVPLLERFDRGEGTFALLARLHGGHRLLVPRLLYLAEYEFFDGRNLFLVSVGVALQGVLAAVVARAVWAERRRSGAALTAFGLGLVAMLAFSATQLENFVRPWNVHWFLTNAAVAVCLAAGLRAGGVGDAVRSRSEASAWGWWLLASVAAWVASYSMATGLLSWPLLLLLGFLVRWRLRLLVAIGLEGALAIAFYLRGSRVLDAGSSLTSGGALVEWLLACLGSPLSWLSRDAGIALALAATLAAAALLLRLLARRSEASRGECLLVGLMLFSWGAAALIALGRTALWPESWEAARYQTIVLLFWLSLLLLALLALRGERPHQRVLRPLLMLGAAVWLAVAVLPGHFRQAGEIGSFVAKARAANLALLFGVSQRPDYVHVLTFSDRKLGFDSAAAYWGFLHERGLGVFSDPRRDLMGRVLDEAFSRADPDLCRGEVIRADPVPTRYGPALRLGGWAWDIAASRPPSYLLATDARRSIVGLGTPLRRKLGPLRWREDERPAWHGYARVRSGSFDVWALLESGEVCQIARARRSMKPR
jgi:hypothetical protein